MSKTTGARMVAEAFKGYGVSHVFFVPQMLMETLVEMEGMGIQRCMVHGEKAAAYMADGYARASRRPGVCFAQHVGASNLAAGLRDAYLACSPVVAITGGTAPANRYRHAYQELEDFGQFDKTTKFNAHVDDVGRLPYLLRQAFREATIGSPGPVHLQMRGHHAEVLSGETSEAFFVEERYKEVPPFRPAADQADVEQALKVLHAAERPIIVAGGGVSWSSAGAEIVALAEKLNIPVATSLNAKGAILDTHPLSVGVIGNYSRACANQAVYESDLVFFIGSHTGGQVTTRWKVPKPGSRIMHLDIDAREFGRNYPTVHSLLGDARTVLRQMIDVARNSTPRDRTAWVAHTQGLVAAWQKHAAPQRDSEAVPMRPERACREISKVLPDNAVVVSDTGHSGIWTGSMIDFNRCGQRLIRCAGTLGWGLPGALGVKCALPDTPVVCFAGDGGVYYHLAELETAARYGINAVIIVNNNSALNQEIPHFNHAYHGQAPERGEALWGFSERNFADVAKSLGCVGMRVEEPAELGPALTRAFAANKPVVIDLVTDKLAFADKAWTGE
jgi:acetolactate synthase I/II/III large subunit